MPLSDWASGPKLNPSSFTIQRVNPFAFKSVLIDLMARNLELPSPEQRFDWIAQNPDGEAIAWLLFHEDHREPIASCKGIPRRYRSPDGEKTALLLADVCSNEGFRFALPALLLQRQIREDFLAGELSADFLLCGPIPSLAAVQKRAGMAYLGAQTRWSKPISLLRLRRIGREYPLPIAVGADCLLATKRLFSSKGSGQFDLLKHAPGAEFDQFEIDLDQSADAFRPARSAPFLNWRFMQHPFYNHEILTLRRNQILQGYAVISARHPGVKTIVDIRSQNDVDFSSLVKMAERRANKAGAGALWIHLNERSKYCDLLKSNGFQARSKPVRITAQNKPNDDCGLVGKPLFDADFDV